MKLKGAVLCHSVKETHALAKAYAAKLKSGSVLALMGDLGSGKTTFMKGLVQGLGFKKKDEVTSPTFTLMNVYHGKYPIYHFDLYRLESQKEILSTGFEEFVNDPQAVICIEWAERAGKLLPKAHLPIYFEVIGPETRKIRLP